MRRHNSNNGKRFYVVQFIELPFDDIDKYVCIPHSWIISRTASGEKAVIAYPNDEDPLAIKDRVKKKEKPNEEWRFYMAFIEYESDTFEDADNWIETRNSHKPCEIENSGKNMRDSQPELTLNRKLRSASRPFFTGTIFDKPSVSVKPYKNPRRPLPRISIRLPPQPILKKNMGSQRVKLDEVANPVSSVINHTRTVSDHLKEKQSITARDSQLIQNTQTGTAAALHDKTSSEHTIPDSIKGDKSVMSDQSASPKLTDKNQPSPAGQIGEQALSLPDIDTGFDEDHHDDDVADHVQSEPFKEDAIFRDKIPANNPEEVPQSKSLNERSTPLVHHKHSLPDLRLQDEPARQSKEAAVNLKTQLLQLLSTPITVPRASSTSNQLPQGKYPQSAFLPSTSAAHQDPRPQGTNAGSLSEVTHNHQRPLSQDNINNTSCLPHSITNLMNPSAPLLHPSLKKKSSPAAKNPAVKKICLENITRNTSTRQNPSKEASRQPISNARSDFGVNAINLSVSQQCMTTSTAPNFPYSAEYSHFLAKQSQGREYSAMQENYLQHIARQSNTVWQPNNRQSIDRRAHQPVMMNREFTSQNKQNSIGQPYPLFLHYNNQYVPLSRDYMQEMLRYGETSLREPIDRAHPNSKPNTQNVDGNHQFSALNLSNQLHPYFEHPKQRQNPPRFQDLSGHYPKFKADFQETQHRAVIEITRSPALPETPSQSLLNAQRGYFLQDPRVRVKLNQNPTEHQIVDSVVPGNLVDRVEPTTVNAEVQTAPLLDRLDETPSTLLPGIGIVYQNPRTKKLVVNQTTEVDPVMDVDHCEDEAAESSDRSAPQVADSGCQADGCFVEEEDSPYQETDSESEISTHDEVLNRGECEDHPRVDTVSEIRPTCPQNPQMQQRLPAEHEMLNMYGTLFTLMGASFHHTRDLFIHLRNSIIKCAEVYESLLETVVKSNKTEQLSTSLPNDETSRASEENTSENSSTENITDVSSAPKMNHPQRNTLVLPPEYDPNNPKWVRKYQKKERGLIELIPRTNVYVSKKELKNCKRESKDCRTFARMLLTAIFSTNALSVCSLTGGKAKAFNSLNLDVRPGLDEDARMVLLTFVEKYGAKRGWKTDDTAAIISSIRTKILEIRTKYGQASSA